MGTFEGNLGPSPVTGTLTAAVQDPNGVAPISIIRLPNAWAVKVDWTLEGSLVNMFAGTWRVTVVLEGMGNLFEDVVATTDIDIATGGAQIPTGLSYTHTFNIQGNYPGLGAGVYKVVTVVTSLSAGNAAGAFAAFEEGPMIQFYP